MTKALIIPVQGEPEVRDIDANSLATLQGIVGGYLEGVTLASDAHLYCNEEGKLQGLPYNDLATRIVRTYLPGWQDVIVGDVAVLSSDEEGGETDVPQHMIDAAGL